VPLPCHQPLSIAHLDLQRQEEQRRQEQLGEQGVAHVVCAELDLVALGCLGGWTGHDARVVDEDVEAVGLEVKVATAFFIEVNEARSKGRK